MHETKIHLGIDIPKIDCNIKLSFYKKINERVWPKVQSIFLLNSNISDKGCFYLTIAHLPNVTSVTLSINVCIKISADSLKWDGFT